ncbi:MAG: CotH kinase family protein [Desulfofustis sp.]|nr:CotH kinase family protein [Desulfofustis sp.]
MPVVNIVAEAETLTGESGILVNKERKGRAWEVPADIIFDNGSDLQKQRVGLRFHGGGVGRTKYTESFRVYARQRYGKSEFDPLMVFGQTRLRPLTSIVLKYTYQAYYEKRQDFNPFNHSFALDIADHIGALVPSHGLVDFYLNDEPKGLYLAMEHLSDKTIGNWLGHEDFTVYYYRKHNPESIENLYALLLAQIRLAQGEAAFEAFRRIFDVDNVLNSILLSLYIADDDFCQGAEVIRNDFESPGAIITSINWDLDHAFLTYDTDNGTFSVDPSRSAMYILQEPSGLLTCQKRFVYAWLYSQSKQFRTQLRHRLEQLMKKELSPAYLSRLLEPYRRINEQYFDGDFEQAIRDLEAFTSRRSTLLLEQLSAFEKEIETPAD